MRLTDPEARKIVDEGRMLELNVPQSDRCNSQNYLLWKTVDGEYRYDVHYGGEEKRRDPIGGDRNWDRLVGKMTIPLSGDGWDLMNSKKHSLKELR